MNCTSLDQVKERSLALTALSASLSSLDLTQKCGLCAADSPSVDLLSLVHHELRQSMSVLSLFAHSSAHRYMQAVLRDADPLSKYTREVTPRTLQLTINLAYSLSIEADDLQAIVNDVGLNYAHLCANSRLYILTFLVLSSRGRLTATCGRFISR